MSNNNVVLKRWEERVISNEKGNRIVHYRVVDNHGNSPLTIVVRERNPTHMTYTAKRDFGPMNTIRAGTTWNSRTSVVELLSSIISPDSDEQKISIATHPKKAWMARFSSMSDNMKHEEGPTQPLAKGYGGLHQAKKAYVEKTRQLRSPRGSSEAEESREATLQSLGRSTSEGKKIAINSSIVDNKRTRRAAGVDLSRPHGPSAASGVSLNDDVKFDQSNDRRA